MLGDGEGHSSIILDILRGGGGGGGGRGGGCRYPASDDGSEGLRLSVLWGQLGRRVSEGTDINIIYS